jgi:hypothetical protein
LLANLLRLLVEARGLLAGLLQAGGLLAAQTR